MAFFLILSAVAFGVMGFLVLFFSRQFYLYRAVPERESRAPWLYLALRALGYLLFAAAALVLVKAFWFTAR